MTTSSIQLLLSGTVTLFEENNRWFRKNVFFILDYHCRQQVLVFSSKECYNNLRVKATRRHKKSVTVWVKTTSYGRCQFHLSGHWSDTFRNRFSAVSLYYIYDVNMSPFYLKFSQYLVINCHFWALIRFSCWLLNFYLKAIPPPSTSQNRFHVYCSSAHTDKTSACFGPIPGLEFSTLISHQRQWALENVFFNRWPPTERRRG
jgi:hypothetical protein